MKFYRDKITGKKVVEVDDLSFLKQRNHQWGWFRRHFNHFRLKFALCRADRIYVPNCEVAVDLVRYYFVPKDKIAVDIEKFPHLQPEPKPSKHSCKL